MSACRWCKKDHGDKPVWHPSCAACGDDYEQPRKVGRPRETCGKPLCIAIFRFVRLAGRWPPRVWFARYAVDAGLAVKLPKPLERIAAGPPMQRDLFSRGAA